MNNRVYRDEDEWLATTLRSQLLPPPDDGFTGLVVARLNRRQRWRRVILAAAGGTGLALALLPVAAIVSSLSATLPPLIAALGFDSGSGVIQEWLAANSTQVAAAIAAFLSPLAVAAFED
jgi:hypothetical protein